MECVIFFCKNIIDKLKPYVITNYIIDIIGDFIMIRLKKVFNLTEEEIVLTNEIAEAISKEPP